MESNTSRDDGVLKLNFIINLYQHIYLLYFDDQKYDKILIYSFAKWFNSSVKQWQYQNQNYYQGQTYADKFSWQIFPIGRSCVLNSSFVFRFLPVLPIYNLSQS